MSYPRGVRNFETGATRDQDADKPNYEGFLHPLVIKAYGAYMHKHRFQSDGTVRAADNWQLGLPPESLMQSGWRHFLDWWLEYKGFQSRDGVEDALCGLLFNAQAYLLRILLNKETLASARSAGLATVSCTASMKVVYLAHKIRDRRGIWYFFQNHRTAELIALELWRMGFAVICPGKNTENFDGAAPDDIWLRGDLRIIDRCDALVLAPNWGDSPGAQVEREHALQKNIPVFEWEHEQNRIREFAVS